MVFWAWLVRLASGLALWRPDKLAKFIMYVIGGIIGALLVFGIFYKLFLKDTYNTKNTVSIEKVTSYYAVPMKKTNDWCTLTLFNMKLGITTEDR